jgi:hypothetical protein
MSGSEERTRRALAGLPGPSAEATERARRAALDALPEAAPRPRMPRRKRAVLAVGLATALAVATAGIALATTGRLEVRIGDDTPSERVAATPPVGRIALPEGVNGIAAIASGRLWMASHTGFRVEGLAVTAAELSPNARYAAAGIGDSLVVLAPDGRRPWSLPVGGRVVAAAWRPNPLPTEIAYVVRRGGHHELRVVEADGDGDRLLDPSVAPVRPSWRFDTPSLAYVTASGRLRILDLARGTAITVPAARRVQAVAYGPLGAALAWLQRPGAVGFMGLGKGPEGVFPSGEARATGIAWTSVGSLATVDRRADGLWRVRLVDPGSGVREPIGPIGADARGRLVISVGRELRLAETPGGRGVRPLGSSPVLLRLPPGLRAQTLSVR